MISFYFFLIKKNFSYECSVQCNGFTMHVTLMKDFVECQFLILNNLTLVSYDWNLMNYFVVNEKKWGKFFFFSLNI